MNLLEFSKRKGSVKFNLQVLKNYIDSRHQLGCYKETISTETLFLSLPVCFHIITLFSHTQDATM